MAAVENAIRFRAADLDLGGQAGTRTFRLHAEHELGPVLEALGGRMWDVGYSRKDLFAADLALTEAVANAVKHGHRGDPRKTVTVAFLVAAGEVFLEVADEGDGFAPDSVADPRQDANLDRPSGRGLLLMRAYMDLVEFHDCGTRVVMRRRRTET